MCILLSSLAWFWSPSGLPLWMCMHADQSLLRWIPCGWVPWLVSKKYLNDRNNNFVGKKTGVVSSKAPCVMAYGHFSAKPETRVTWNESPHGWFGMIGFELGPWRTQSPTWMRVGSKLRSTICHIFTGEILGALVWVLGARVGRGHPYFYLLVFLL